MYEWCIINNLFSFNNTQFKKKCEYISKTMKVKHALKNEILIFITIFF